MSPRNVGVEGNAHVVVNPASYNCLCRLAQIVVLYVFTVKPFLTATASHFCSACEPPTLVVSSQVTAFAPETR